MMTSMLSWLPEVRAVSDETLGGACGAYCKDEHTVYLSESVLRNPALAIQAMLEEVGHHLDTLFNAIDAEGNEGGLFRALLIAGRNLSPEEQDSLRTEDDHGTISVDGRELEVEFWWGSDAIDWVGDNVIAPVAEFVGEHGTQILGGLQAVGGAIEVAIGIGVAATAHWTGVGAVLGGIMIANGLDNFVAGSRTVASGTPTSTITAEAGAMLGEAAGMSPEDARLLGEALNIFVGTLGGCAAGGGFGGLGSLGSLGSLSTQGVGILQVAMRVGIGASAAGALAGAIPGAAAAAAAMVGNSNGTSGWSSLSNKEARALANDLGFSEVKDPPFNSHGKLVFKKGNRYISADADGHNGGVWKMYDNKGNRLGTYNSDLTVKVGP